MSINYTKSGVNYSKLDPFKILAEKFSLLTSKNFRKTEYKEIARSRGESAYIVELSDRYLAFVAEGLGTKNLIADEMRKITGKSYYDIIAYDTVISIVMDLTTVGARPVVVSAYWAIGDVEWLEDKIRMKDLITGWVKACGDVGAVWGGGETPILKDIVNKDTIDLAGAAFGEIKPKNRIIIGDKLSIGDNIIMFESNGIHVNGLTLARKLAHQLPSGYATKLPNNKFYGEELLSPTRSYARLIQELLDNSVDIHYMVNITGHGWRKIMRARKNYTYLIEKIPPYSYIFQFIQKKAGLDAKEMFSTFNMGAGLAIYIPEREVRTTLNIADKFGIKAWVVGAVEKGPRQVIIKPLKITYKSKELEIR